MNKFAWTVSDFHNVITRRNAAALQQYYDYHFATSFNSENEAVSFIIKRAAQNVRTAQLAAKHAEETLRKLKKKFNR